LRTATSKTMDQRDTDAPLVQITQPFVYGVRVKRRKRRPGPKPQAPADPLRGLFDELGETGQPPSPPVRSESVALPAAHIAAPVARLAYTRSQAAAALGISPSTFGRRVVPLIDMIEMPWGTKLVPVDELERLVSEHRRPARPASKARTAGRPPMV